MLITMEIALATIDKLVEGKEDYSYRETHESCVYADTADSAGAEARPSCLIGRALHEWGVPAEVMLSSEWAGILGVLGWDKADEAGVWESAAQVVDLDLHDRGESYVAEWVEVDEEATRVLLIAQTYQDIELSTWGAARDAAHRVAGLLRAQ